MIASIAFVCSGVTAAAGAARRGTSATRTPSHNAAAHQRPRGSDDRRTSSGILGSIGKVAAAGSLVETFRLAVDVLGAEIGRGVLGQRLLGAIGLLDRVLLLAVGERFLGQ